MVVLFAKTVQSIQELVYLSIHYSLATAQQSARQNDKCGAPKIIRAMSAPKSNHSSRHSPTKAKTLLIPATTHPKARTQERERQASLFFTHGSIPFMSTSKKRMPIVAQPESYLSFCPMLRQSSASSISPEDPSIIASSFFIFSICNFNSDTS